jgi:hypothetical protein
MITLWNKNVIYNFMGSYSIHYFIYIKNHAFLADSSLSMMNIRSSLYDFLEQLSFKSMNIRSSRLSLDRLQ